MDNYKSFESLLYTVNEHNLDDIVLPLFRYQAIHNPVYASYLKHLGTNLQNIKRVTDIPFLPISFFKKHMIKTGLWEDETYFTSSGTTGQSTSVHHIADLNFYLQHAERCFNYFFSKLTDYHFFALMPSYLERENSSLIAMMNSFISKSGSEFSGFYLDDYEKLLKDINNARKKRNKKIILWGVSFALLDIAEKYQPDLNECLVFETGGMKGRRKEIVRQDLHDRLKKGFHVERILSEYGMTELLSQAYSNGGNTFKAPPWMKMIVRDVADPFEKGQIGRSGGINVIDLANFRSISFIETEDSGTVFADGTFEVLGRIDNSDRRGCNLLVE
ncbi:MAG TPA: acyl transferase [Cyclobacteriaceae bacterium]|nr:acyl transferase [Cyclobacteriaceae bacterium]